jgi:serine protein kinase
MTIFDNYAARYERTREEEYSLSEYLQLCKKDPLTYASAPERMLAAIGEPTLVDTRLDSRLSRIFANKVIKLYPAFREFYGMEEVIEQVVSYFRHAAQGLEERKQILYLLGPVGGGKSSIAEKLKSLMEQVPFYAIKGSPVNESPLGLFNEDEDGAILEEDYGIPRRYLRNVPSPWAVKRLHEFGGDINKFRVVKRYPSILKQVAIAKTEPGDENNQDISSLVGKVDIRKLEDYSQDDPDAYSYSGGLCLANQGLMEFVEMFKAPIKVLHPLLTATQEGNYKGTEGFGAIPFDGIILAHSNESEWKTFRNNRNNEAFLDRIYIVKVPYCLRVSDEVKIYDKLLRNSSLDKAPCAPGHAAHDGAVRDPVAPEGSGELQRLFEDAGLRRREPEGHRSQGQVAARIRRLRRRGRRHERPVDPLRLQDPVQGLQLRQYRSGGQSGAPAVRARAADRARAVPAGTEQRYLSYIKEHLAQRYVDFIGKEIQTAYLESYSEYGQNIFDRYVTFADFWIQDQEFRDPDTGESFDRESLNAELEKIEKPAGISNPKDFRNEIVNFALRARATNGGKNPAWTSYEKFRTVIEKKMFSNTEELLPVISFNAKASTEDATKHADFVARMVEKATRPSRCACCANGTCA